MIIGCQLPAELQAIACSEAQSGEALCLCEDARELEARTDGLLLDRWTIREDDARREASGRIAELACLAQAHRWTVEDGRDELMDAATKAEQ